MLHIVKFESRAPISQRLRLPIAILQAARSFCIQNDPSSDGVQRKRIDASPLSDWGVWGGHPLASCGAGDSGP